MTMNKRTQIIRKVTCVILIATAALWILWDFVPFANPSSGDTISEVIAEYAMKIISLPLAFGVLCGHFFFLRDGKKPRPSVLIPVALAAIAFDAASNVWNWNLIVHEYSFIPFILGVPIGFLFWPQGKSDKQ